MLPNSSKTPTLANLNNTPSLKGTFISNTGVGNVETRPILNLLNSEKKKIYLEIEVPNFRLKKGDQNLLTTAAIGFAKGTFLTKILLVWRLIPFR